MLLTELINKINYDKAELIIRNFIKEYLRETGAHGAVIGLSGGVDSSVVATLLVKALGRNNVLGLIMPHAETSDNDLKDAVYVAELLGITYKVIRINGILKDIIMLSPWLTKHTDKIVKGNIIARIRMLLLYYHANALKMLVAGTGDKSEYLIGYFTKFGDGAADFFPILDLYKSQVRELAKYLNLPEKIWKKPSSPGLWRGHLAKEELGFEYNVIDQVLFGYFEKKLKIEELAKLISISESDVRNILARVERTRHKRKPPPYPQIS